ncbi:MAG: hypothetical protein CME26_13675 [Gemmatimonadetes bacterium]|nr:hypothetical protein [Gemmatimonadota bacterium]|tara:strand:- start:4370 stop:4924 length:555 start_codon:yes stop_codon:yes gene_type:complete
MKKWIAVGTLVFAFTAADQAYAQADVFVDENGNGIDDTEEVRHRFGRRGMFGIVSLLTDEQKASLSAEIEALKASDATREEIRDAVHASLEGCGIDLPTARLELRYGEVLSEDQIAHLAGTLEGLHEAGASREDVRAAVDAKFEEFGVERPSFAGRGGKGFGRRGRMGGRHDAPADGAATEDAN